MGKQIGFYFAPEDEQAMADFLCTMDFLCIPRICATEKPKLVTPAEVLQREVKLVHRDYVDIAIDSLSTPNQRFWHLVTAGLYIEWQRSKSNTIMSDRYSGPPVYSHPGRFYFPTSPPGDNAPSAVIKSGQVLNKKFSAIVRHVKKISTAKSAGKHPYYVGRNLVNMLNNGVARIFYANGVSPIYLSET